MTAPRASTVRQRTTARRAAAWLGSLSDLGQRIFDRYEIFGRRQGGLGIVLFVTDTETGLDYAVKICGTAHKSSRAAVEEFRAEVAFWLRLPRHPNIVAAHFARGDADHPLLFLDYEPGGSLRDLLDRETRLPTMQALSFAHQLCCGMEAANRQGEMAHLDLKPENLLIRNGRCLRITDFGLSRRVQIVDGRYQPVTAGTWPYAAPECFSGEAGDSRSDVYALGVLLHEMLTGELPHPSGTTGRRRGFSRLARFHARRGMNRVTERLYYQGLPGQHGRAIGELLSACLQHCRAERPESFESVRRILEHHFPELERARPATIPGPSPPLDLALGLQTLGRHSEALEVLNRILSANPGHGQAWIAAARSLSIDGDEALALDFLARAAACAPSLQEEIMRTRAWILKGEPHT